MTRMYVCETSGGLTASDALLDDLSRVVAVAVARAAALAAPPTGARAQISTMTCAPRPCRRYGRHRSTVSTWVHFRKPGYVTPRGRHRRGSGLTAACSLARRWLAQAKILTNSLGSTSPYYTATAHDIDQYVHPCVSSCKHSLHSCLVSFGARFVVDNPDTLVVYAAGNQGGIDESLGGLTTITAQVNR